LVLVQKWLSLSFLVVLGEINLYGGASWGASQSSEKKSVLGPTLTFFHTSSCFSPLHKNITIKYNQYSLIQKIINFFLAASPKTTFQSYYNRFILV
jgi:hypothetical protein